MPKSENEIQHTLGLSVTTAYKLNALFPVACWSVLSVFFTSWISTWKIITLKILYISALLFSFTLPWYIQNREHWVGFICNLRVSFSFLPAVVCVCVCGYNDIFWSKQLDSLRLCLWLSQVAVGSWDSSGQQILFLHTRYSRVDGLASATDLLYTIYIPLTSTQSAISYTTFFIAFLQDLNIMVQYVITNISPNHVHVIRS